MLIALKSWLKLNTRADDPLYEYKKTGQSYYIEQAIDTYSCDIFHFIRSQSNRVLAEDICQKTWLTVVEKRHTYNQQNTPKAWLFSIARNALIDELRKTKRIVQLDDTTLIAAQSDNSHIDTLYQAMTQLPFLQREALMLQLEGFSLQEIAHITHQNHETIKTRLRYAKQHLKATMEPNDG
ncbi:RNA polymerase sigma factor [Pseudoalteromonas sp. MMG012]|uniref:RNA polymerase sigma factor n=1 Tax=Pseudoalteromonas sp. MMG012 TaxID=2822686 RepID=UPI001B3A4185|nr:RNA polymerase sigma factor [Pseudoalteromonas sp. MMG012]MBQ4852352.1 RNA polymerase sigma factor [Pseudoalteromonas sp. MMG012]